MHNKKESIQNEIIRMLKLSEFRNPIQKNKEVSNKDKKIIKEDFIDDINDAFNQDALYDIDLNTNGNKSILTNEMKVAMLAHSLNEFEAAMLELYKNFKPKDYNKYTNPAKKNDLQGTYYDKKKDLKLRGQVSKDDLTNLKNTAFGKKIQTRLGKDNQPINSKLVADKDQIIKDPKSIRMPATFVDSDEDLKNITKRTSGGLQKWWHNKDVNMISYDSNSKKLTELGKAQLEFLARAYTTKPIDEFESTLFSLFGKQEGNYHFSETAEKILREFFSLVMIPYIMNLTKRAKYNPNDNQLKEFIENGVNHALDNLSTYYDPQRGNLGSFMITAVKNDVVNQLKQVADYKLDIGYVNDYLSSVNGPITITSIANPNESSGNYNNVKELGKTKSGKQIYGYIYNEPLNALTDFTNDARGSEEKPSPLSKRFIYGNSKSLFYKSFPPGTFEDIKLGMDYKDENPYETQSIFQVETLPQQAKTTIYEILNQIADVMISDLGKHAKSDNDYDSDYNYVSKNVTPLLKSNKQDFIELMYELLGFGQMVQVYTKTWEILNKKGKITKKPIGSPVVYNTDEKGNKEPVKNVNGEIPGPDDIQMVWSSGSLSEEEVKQKFLEKFIAKIANTPGDSANRKLIQIFQDDPKQANAIISAIRGGLRKFFGFEGLQIPALLKNRNKLNTILNNYEASMLAEHMARIAIRKYLNNSLKD